MRPLTRKQIHRQEYSGKGEVLGRKFKNDKEPMCGSKEERAVGYQTR